MRPMHEAHEAKGGTQGFQPLSQGRPANPDGRERLHTAFLGGSAASLMAYRAAVAAAADAVIRYFAAQPKPYSGAGPGELRAALQALGPFPEEGAALESLLRKIGHAVLQHSVVVSHPACAAHLHCPPLTAALAAEVLISATNQSLDSWDQGPAATMLEEQTVDWLCRLAGYDERADGVFTSGGTLSNLMGLLLARDHYARTRLNWRIQTDGLPPEAGRFRILCSEVAHFTVRQSAALLGLGDGAVVPVATDDRRRLCPQALDRRLAEIRAQDRLPIALVATAGTTDFGSIDPLPELSTRARAHGLWLHVDAAYGGALLLSSRHRERLAGIEEADSIAIDFHKLFYQPISCGAFLLRDGSRFDLMRLHADYLNPADDEAAGIPNLVTKSLQTTRRFDALKLFISMHQLGRRAFADMLDYTIALATDVARLIAARPSLELAHQPELNAVVFRYLPGHAPAGTDRAAWANRVNRGIRTALLRSGQAVLAQTRVAGLTYLKFTLLNPRATPAHIEGILDMVCQLGAQLERAEHGRDPAT